MLFSKLFFLPSQTHPTPQISLPLQLESYLDFVVEGDGTLRGAWVKNDKGRGLTPPDPWLRLKYQYPWLRVAFLAKLDFTPGWRRRVLSI